MSDLEPSADRDPQTPVRIEPAEAGGIRSWVLYASSLALLNEKVALIVSEHLRDDDELHVSHAAVQSGWTHHPARAVLRDPAAPLTRRLHGAVL